jgi:hypothetical protein
LTLNWLRAWSLNVGSYAVDGSDPNALRVTFSIEQRTAQTPGKALFRIWNPSPSTVGTLQGMAPTDALSTNGPSVTFSAGYEDNIGVVFSGQLHQVISGHENAVDSYVDIYAADGRVAQNVAAMSQTLAKGHTHQDRLQAAVTAMGPYGVTMGNSNVDLSSPTFPRAYVMSGMARDVIRQVAKDFQSLWFILNGQVNLFDPTQPGANGTVNLDPSTGLVGWPKQTTQGITTTSLINPALMPGCQITLDPSLIIGAPANTNFQDSSGAAATANQELDQMRLSAGTYNVFALNRRGDSRGQDWYDEALSIGIGGSLPKAMADAGFSVGN